MKVFKQALVPLLVLVLALACLVGLTLTASADDTSEYSLWVGTTPVNSDNKDDVLGDGTVSYDPSTHTLTLDNASITQWRRMYAYMSGTEANIYFGDSGNALTIVLIGDNSMNATMNGTAAAYGIKTDGDLHIQGAGTLTFSGNPQIAINAGTYSALYFDDAVNCPTVNIPNCTRYGLYARDITIYSAHIDIYCDCTNRNTQSSHQYECTAAGVYAERTLTIGRENTQETTYVHAQVPEVSNSTPYHALYGGSSITLPYTRAIVRPSNGSLGTYYNYSYYGQIVKDSASTQAFDVLIKTFALPANYEEYPLWVNAIRADSLNAGDVLEDGTVSYDAEHHILTLNGATVTNAYSGAGIRYEGTDALTIVAKGNNTIAAANQAYGICAPYANLLFHGNGTVNISNAGTWGVFTNNELRFDEPNASDAAYHPTLNITAYKGISAYDITLYRAVLNITATANTQPTEAKGIDADRYLKIGEGSQELQTNDVSITLHCADGCKAIEASYGTITISNPDAIVTPAGGSISTDGHTIVDGEGTTASNVVILVEPYIVKYDLWVNGDRVTENNCNTLLNNTAIFNPTTNTLTFTDNTSLSSYYEVGTAKAAIYTTLPELHVEIASGKTLQVSYLPADPINTAILVPENTTLNIGGNGTISLANTVANGIVAGTGSTINLNAGTLDLQASAIGIDAAGSTVNLGGSTLRLSGEPYGMDVGSFTMTGGTLTANMITNNNTTVAAIRAGSFTMSGGTLTAHVEGASAEKAIYATGSFTMTGGTLNASVEGASAQQAIYTTGSFTMTGGTLNAGVSGDSAETAIYAANGIHISDSLQISAPEHCLPWGGTVNTHLRDVTGAAAAAVQIQPPDAGSATAYDFHIGQTQITDQNRNNPLGDGTATYDDSTHTLYLDNAQLGRYEDNLYGSSHIFYTEADALTVCLFGESTYTISPTNTDPGTANRGIYAYNADLRIIGDGKLTMHGYFAGIECGLDHSVTFGDETTCPTLVITGSQYGVHARNIYIDRANLDVTCSGGFQSSGNAYCENAALCAESSGWYGNIRIGAEDGEGGVTLHATVGRQADKCYAIYAKHELRIMDNEGIVTPNGGGILNSTGVHTVVEGQKNTSAYEVRIAPQEPPAAVENGYQLWLNGVQVCQANKDALPGLPAGCCFDPGTNTLYLTGKAVFDRPMIIDSKGCAIYSKLPDLTIVLADDAEVDLSGHSYGVYAGRNCNIHIRGSGRMDIHDTAYGIVCNDRGRLYFDGTDADQRPVLRIEATHNGLLSNFIYLWNCNVTASGQTAIKATTYYTVPYNQAVYDGGVIEIGTTGTAAADAWKNNAAVYATGTYAFFAETVLYGDQIVAGSLTLSGEEMVLLPNNAEIVSYNKNISGFRFRDSITKDDVRTVYVIPRGEEPDQETPYELWINGLQVYAANAYDLPGLPGSWFDGPSRTLYLNGYVTLDGVSVGKDAPIYTTLADLTIVLDYGRATLCSEQHSYGIYSTQNLHIRGGGEMVIANAALEAIHVGGTLSFDDVDFAPLVSAYSYQYGIRAGSIVLRQANLNAIVFNTDRTQGSGAVANAAILANNITIGADSDEVYQNNVTLYASCDDTEGFQGYALYADSTLSHPSSYIDILEPTTDAAWGTHTITRAGSKAGTVRLGINQKAYYVNILEDYEDPSDAPDLPAVTLNGHEDFRAFPGKTVSFTVTPPKNYNLDTLRVYYFDENDIEQEVTVTSNTFTMPEADVYLDASFVHRNYRVTVVDPEGGTVEAGCQYANSNERVDVTFDEDAGYLWSSLAITTAGGETVNYSIEGGAMGSGQGHFHVFFYMPNDNVTVNVTFAKALYNIYTTYSTNGSVTPGSDKASCGDLVTLTIAPGWGYALDTLTVTGTESNQTVSVNSNYQFVMPAENVRVTASFRQARPTFVGHSLSLDGDIGVNFVIDLNGGNADDFTVTFTWDTDKSRTVALSDATLIPAGEPYAGCYKVTAPVAAKEMTDTVTATICQGSTEIASNAYSVKEYCDTILADTAHATYSETLWNLARAMLLYGAKAQTQFSYRTDDSADKDLADKTLTPLDADEITGLGTITLDQAALAPLGLQFYGTSLVLESETTLRLYFKVTDAAAYAGTAVYRNGEKLTAKQNGSYIYFEIADIAAKEVLNDFTLDFGTVGNAGTEQETFTKAFDARFNAGAYIGQMLKPAHDGEPIQDTVTALYRYSKAALAYFAAANAQP